MRIFDGECLWVHAANNLKRESSIVKYDKLVLCHAGNWELVGNERCTFWVNPRYDD